MPAAVSIASEVMFCEYVHVIFTYIYLLEIITLMRELIAHRVMAEKDHSF